MQKDYKEIQTQTKTDASSNSKHIYSEEKRGEKNDNDTHNADDENDTHDTEQEEEDIPEQNKFTTKNLKKDEDEKGIQMTENEKENEDEREKAVHITEKEKLDKDVGDEQGRGTQMTSPPFIASATKESELDEEER